MPSSPNFLPTDPAIMSLPVFDRIAAPTQRRRTIAGVSLGDCASGVALTSGANGDMAAETPLEGCAYGGDDLPVPDAEFCSAGCAHLAALEE